jgi:hypothetical protein
MTDKQINEHILRIIARDDELTEQFRKAIGESRRNFNGFLDYVEIPELRRRHRCGSCSQPTPEDEAEQLRRDEKHGLYGGREDVGN